MKYFFKKEMKKIILQQVFVEQLVQKTWVWSLGWEDPMEKGQVTHSSIRLENSMDYSPWNWTTFHDYSPWGCKELDMTERLSLYIIRK